MILKQLEKDYKLNEKQSIYKTAGLVYHQEVLGDIRICYCIDHFYCSSIRL